MSGMKSAAAETRGNPAWADAAELDLEKECEAWDWARAAGVSAADLRRAVRASLAEKGSDPI